MPPKNNGWDEWKNFVLDKLEQNATEHDIIRRKLDELSTIIGNHCARADLAAKYAKAWGAAAAAVISPATYFIIQHLLGK